MLLLEDRRVDCWQPRVTLYVMRPPPQHGHETHSSVYIDGVTDQEAADIFRYCGGSNDQEVTSWKRLHIEIAQPRCLGCSFVWIFTVAIFLIEILLQKFY